LRGLPFCGQDFFQIFYSKKQFIVNKTYLYYKLFAGVEIALVIQFRQLTSYLPELKSQKNDCY